MKITTKFKKLNKVVHLADVHIRLFKRHEEYRQAFNTLYHSLKSLNMTDGVIVVAGDILHAKTDMSPEMVDLASEFLSTLAEIAPTLVIAGNHDLNLSNMNRLDSLTPLIKNISHPNLHYLKHSGVYEVADVDFAVMSILDDKSEWPTPEDCRKKARKIALFHGPLHGAMTDAKFQISNRDVNKNTFDGFDIVMLGDIHKYQVLQDKAPVIVYSSSLIQQNHGESLENHGWVLWDMNDCSHKFNELNNDYGYVTMEIIKNKISYPKRIPKNIRLRLFTGESDASVVKKAITTLRKRYNISELSVNKNTIRNVSSASTNQSIVDVSLVSNQNTLIQKWLESRDIKEEDTLKKVLDINAKMNSSVVHEDYSRNVHWKPIKFTFSNMFSYGKGNIITFEGLTGINGIFASNASGKSSSMDALMFCLYDKTPRAFKGDHIMNNRKNSFECELEFEINQEKFFIKRTGTRKKKGDVKVEVSFWKENADGTHTSLNGEDRRDTNANIRSYVGSYDDFVLTTLSSQQGNALFIDKSHSERKDLLIQFMGLNIFDKLYESANNEIKEISGTLKKFRQTDFTKQLADVQKSLELYNMQKTKVDEEINQYKTELEALNTSRGSLVESKKFVPPIEMDSKKIERNIDKYKKAIDEIGESIRKTETKIDENESTLTQIKLKLDSLDEDNINKKYEEYQISLSKLNDRDRELKTLNTTIDSIEKSIDRLSEYKYNRDCNICVQNNQSVIKQTTALTKELNEKQDVKKKVVSDIIKFNRTVEELRPIEIINQEYSELKTQYAQLTYDQTELNYILQNMISKMEINRQELSKYEDLLKKHADNKENIEFNRGVELQILDIDVLTQNISKHLKLSETLSIDLYGKIKVAEKIKEDYIKEIKDAEELEETYEAYEYYMMAVSRDGVPYELMSKAIPSIESEINNILSQIVEFTISLEVDGKNIVGRINYDDTRIWPLENSSGMERFISSLAIRVALLNASNLPKPNFMIIDEGLGTLDSDNLSSMGVLFGILKNQFDFLIIISHLDTARDMVDHVIEIKKEDGFSFINV